MGIHRHAGQGQAEQGQRQADGEGMLARAEQVLDAGHELASMGGVREAGDGPGGGRAEHAVEFGQRERKAATIAQGLGGQVVSDQLAFVADAARQPPHHRVIEQQGLDHGLQQVDQVIVAADMRQFMGEQGLQQTGRHPCDERGGQQHHRPPPADRQRRIAIEQPHPHVARQAELARQFVGTDLPMPSILGPRLPLQAAHPPQATRHAQEQGGDTGNPEHDDPWQRGCCLHRQHVLHAIRACKPCIRADQDGKRIGRCASRRSQQPCQCECRQQQRRRQDRAGHRIACLRTCVAQQRQGRSCEHAQQRALPEEMQQRRAQGRHQDGGNLIHRGCPPGTAGSRHARRR